MHFSRQVRAVLVNVPGKLVIPPLRSRFKQPEHVATSQFLNRVSRNLDVIFGQPAKLVIIVLTLGFGLLLLLMQPAKLGLLVLPFLLLLLCLGLAGGWR